MGTPLVAAVDGVAPPLHAYGDHERLLDGVVNLHRLQVEGAQRK